MDGKKAKDYVPTTDEEIAEYVNDNMWLVRWAIHPLIYKAEYDDLLQEGTIGFLQGIKNYKPNGSAALQTYCYHCIQNAARHYIRDQIPKGGFGKKTVSYSDVFQPKTTASHEGHDSEDNSYSFSTDTDGIHQTEVNIEDEINSDVLVQNIMDTAKRILSPDIYTTFSMHYCGYTQNEIAEKLHQSQATVSKNLGLARTALKKVIPRDSFDC